MLNTLGLNIGISKKSEKNPDNNISFSKYESTCLKGIAVIMLLFYHCFCDRQRIAGYNISFFPFSESSVILISSTLKTCVSIFAFVSGFGLSNSFNKRKNVSTKEWLTRRYMKTMSGFWFIYSVSLLVTMMIKYPIDVYCRKGVVRALLYAGLDFLGLAFLFSTPSLNDTWWYMAAAQLFIFITPIFYTLSKKYGNFTIILILLFIPRLFDVGFPGTTNPYSFIIAVVFGILFYQYSLFSLIDKLIKKRRFIVYIFSALLLVVFLIFSIYIPLDLFWEFNYVFLAIIEILFFYVFVIRIPIVKNALYCIGKESMGIFLIHTFFRDIFFKDFIYSFNHFLLVVTILFLISFALTKICEFLKRIVKYDALINKTSDKLLRAIDNIF